MNKATGRLHAVAQSKKMQNVTARQSISAWVMGLTLPRSSGAEIIETRGNECVPCEADGRLPECPQGIGRPLCIPKWRMLMRHLCEEQTDDELR